ncbi:hypothetical protein CI238_08998 [Colletotrichum incanum]|uniref:Uncharacterized protein n=1 Tax=Colletotrichum incanum TaxID=1573173 RepID=A0A167AP01_COLIC|nr:hypothetical protein CI238_08998 [Colletotrichum incanum]
MGYHHARLIMNRHLYGASHGLPVRILNEDERPFYKTDINFKYTWRARIIDDELFLLITQTVHQPKSNMVRLEEWLNDLGGISPVPLSSQPKFLTPHRNFTADAPPSASLPTFLAGMQRNATLSCPVCLKDAEIKIKWVGAREQWSVEMKTWRQFGTCRSPFDSSWESMTCEPSSRTPEECRAQEHPPGAVRYRWSKGDTQPVVMAGCFLDSTSNK